MHHTCIRDREDIFGPHVLSKVYPAYWQEKMRVTRDCPIHGVPLPPEEKSVVYEKLH